ncbi:MAG TPA: VanZ family protein [Verrucomicrobiae bacterium]|nr:VanZ family protein [Verrucomicrobiae bacterium]
MIRRFIKYWLPVLLWLALIFSASADKGSGHRSSRIIAPIVRWFVPNISQRNLDRIVHTVRKTAHVTEYAILALLLFRALASKPKEDASFPLRAAIFAFGLAALYAMTDEFHQTFVPSREGQVSDVIIDSFGAALALFAVYLVGRWRKRW